MVRGQYILVVSGDCRVVSGVAWWVVCGVEALARRGSANEGSDGSGRRMAAAKAEPEPPSRGGEGSLGLNVGNQGGSAKSLKAIADAPVKCL